MGVIGALYRPRRLLGLVLVALVGCTSDVALRPGAESEQTFSSITAKRTLSYAYAAISDRALVDHSLADTAISGLRGLATIDPLLVVDDRDGAVVVSLAEQQVGRYGRPPADDARAWASLVYNATLAAREVSTDIAAADADQLYESLIEGALSGLDTYSRYATPREAEANRSGRKGFGGIGFTFDVVPEGARVVSVIPDTPASEAGLQQGDVVIAVDGQSLANFETVDLRHALRGPINSRVGLSILPAQGGASRYYSITRRHILPPTVSLRREDGLAIIKVFGFNTETANKVEKTLADLNQPDATPLRGVVLDLRDNPGGLFVESVDVADLLINDGIISVSVGRHRDSNQSFSAHPGDMMKDLPLMVLVDGGSASAAEVLAAALQDQGRALVIGTVSYGKGSVQTVLQLPNKGEIIITWAKLQAPSGYVIDGLGVAPSVCTSGLSQTSLAAPELAIKRAVRGTDLPTLWHGSSAHQDTERQALRRQCPPQAQPGDLPLRVAKRLIEDVPLRLRLLARATSVVAAQAISQ